MDFVPFGHKTRMVQGNSYKTEKIMEGLAAVGYNLVTVTEIPLTFVCCRL